MKKPTVSSDSTINAKRIKKEEVDEFLKLSWNKQPIHRLRENRYVFCH